MMPPCLPDYGTFFSFAVVFIQLKTSCMKHANTFMFNGTAVMQRFMASGSLFETRAHHCHSKDNKY
ncbi:hypothetical protein NP493_1733g00051 [Ridgeia piscesae]|uniref:Uncharacterized protein n=1 Tax=Ridgeia piscesae TaxID=27915 RepID=A0AAD9N6Y5_RIDPI|nr:hypothetical protein NP493_1733g00051 [Ridgeia piscesae]